VPAHRKIAHLVDVFVGMKQLQAIEARRDRRLDRQLAVETEPQQFALKGVVAPRPERVAVLETVIGQRLAEVDAGIRG